MKQTQVHVLSVAVEALHLLHHHLLEALPHLPLCHLLVEAPQVAPGEGDGLKAGAQALLS